MKVWVSIIYPSRAAKVLSLCLSEKEIYFIRCHGFVTKDYIAGEVRVLLSKTKGGIFEFEASCGTVWG